MYFKSTKTIEKPIFSFYILNEFIIGYFAYYLSCKSMMEAYNKEYSHDKILKCQFQTTQFAFRLQDLHITANHIFYLHLSNI